jgi:hypothetical protein
VKQNNEKNMEERVVMKTPSIVSGGRVGGCASAAPRGGKVFDSRP